MGKVLKSKISVEPADNVAGSCKRNQDVSWDDDQKLRTLIYGLPIPQFVIDNGHKVIYWNGALEQISGIKAKTIIGTRNHWKAFYQEKRPTMADLLVDGKMEEIPEFYKGKFIKSSTVAGAYEATDYFPNQCNTGRWLHFNAATIKDSKGNIIGAVETLQDITAQKNAEEALRNSSQVLKGIVYGSPIPQFVIDLGHNVMYWNNALEQISGIVARDVVGTQEHWKAFYKVKRPTMADLLLEGKTEEIIELYKGKCNKSPIVADAYEATDYFPDQGDGGRWLHFTAAPIINAQGRIIGAVETLEDITERKRAQDELVLYERQFSDSVIASLPGIFYVFDQGGYSLRWNVNFQRVTEYSAEELINKNVLSFFAEEDRQAVANTIELASGAGYSSVEANLLTKTGKKIPYFITGARAVIGNEIYLLGIGLDITERKINDEMRDQLNAKLQELSTHDALTGLPNRVLLHDRFNVARANAQRKKNKLAILSLDIDRFKNVNDTMGHDIGDKLLIAVGERMTSVLRKADTVARIGGDEFVLLLGDLEQSDGAFKIAQKILEEFRRPVILSDHTLNVTVSIGVAIFPDDGEDYTDLIKHSDEALYRAKHSGRDNYHL